MDSFCIVGKSESLERFGLASGHDRANAVLETLDEQFAEIASAMALLAMVTSAECAIV